MTKKRSKSLSRSFVLSGLFVFWICLLWGECFSASILQFLFMQLAQHTLVKIWYAFFQMSQLTLFSGACMSILSCWPSILNFRIDWCLRSIVYFWKLHTFLGGIYNHAASPTIMFWEIESSVHRCILLWSNFVHG